MAWHFAMIMHLEKRKKEREGREVEKEKEDGLPDATHQWRSLGGSTKSQDWVTHL